MNSLVIVTYFNLPFDVYFSYLKYQETPSSSCSFQFAGGSALVAWPVQLHDWRLP